MLFRGGTRDGVQGKSGLGLHSTYYRILRGGKQREGFRFFREEQEWDFCFFLKRGKGLKMAGCIQIVAASSAQAVLPSYKIPNAILCVQCVWSAAPGVRPRVGGAVYP